MSTNWKATRVVPGTPATAPYIKGTEKPNYYLVLGESSQVIYGFRPLSTAVPAITAEPKNGEQTRFRVVPKNQGDVAKFEKALGILNFERRSYGDGFIHFSTVVSDSAAFAAKVATLLSFSGCF